MIAQQQEYLITFDELQKLKPDVADGMYKSMLEKEQEKIIFRVLSRPLAQQPTDAPDLAKSMYALMMEVRQDNTDDFMEYYEQRMHEFEAALRSKGDEQHG